MSIRSFFTLISLVGVFVLVSERSEGQTVELLRLSMGDAHVLETEFDLSDIVLGSDNVASVALLSGRSLAVTPVAPGTTRLLLLDSDGQQRRAVSVVVTEDFIQLQTILDQVLGRGIITVRNVNGRPLLAGTIRDELEATRVLDIAQSYATAPVINAMIVADPRQVMLKVNIVELSRSGGRELGIQISDSGFNSGQPAPGVAERAFAVISGSLKINNQTVDMVLRALETKGLARRLANPTLVSVNGSTARFVVGGEVPVVTSDSEGRQTTVYRDYGVQLSFTPTVLPGQRVRLDIVPEVSDVDGTRGSATSPAFITRRVETTVELEDGASFAIAGLLQSDSMRSTRQLPWLADVPILGALFRSADYQNNRTELVVIVTPHLVNESSDANIIADPTQRSRIPSDAEVFLLGAIESNDEMKRRFKSGFGVTGSFGHILPGN